MLGHVAFTPQETAGAPPGGREDVLGVVPRLAGMRGTAAEIVA